MSVAVDDHVSNTSRDGRLWVGVAKVKMLLDCRVSVAALRSFYEDYAVAVASACAVSKNSKNSQILPSRNLWKSALGVTRILPVF